MINFSSPFHFYLALPYSSDVYEYTQEIATISNYKLLKNLHITF